jgi:hypothetical protein
MFRVTPQYKEFRASGRNEELVGPLMKLQVKWASVMGSNGRIPQLPTHNILFCLNQESWGQNAMEIIPITHKIYGTSM